VAGATIPSNYAATCEKAITMNARCRTFALIVTALSAGCIPQETHSIGANDTLANIPAIQDAGKENDRHSIPALVTQLDSDDAAVRFYAITSLNKLTNQTLGYRYYDDVDERRPAVERWRHWLATQPPTLPKQ
jgi:hypothetical protein